jgi:hypothetical protein
MTRTRETAMLDERQRRARRRVLLNQLRRKLTDLKRAAHPDPIEVERLRLEVFDLESKLKRRRHRSDPSVDGGELDEVISVYFQSFHTLVESYVLYYKIAEKRTQRKQ